MKSTIMLRTTAAAFGIAALLLAGCSGGDSQSDASASPAPSQSATESPAAGEATPAPVADIDDTMLLPAEDMPPWNEAVVWTQAPAEDLVADSPACTLPDPSSLGAVESLTATYTGGDTVGGANTIMLFPDEATATAALQAYEQAMPGCLNQEGNDALITDDPAASSWTGSANCDFTGDPSCGANEQLFEFIGVGVDGNTMALVSFQFIGQDANWCMDSTMCPDPRDPVLPEVYLSLDRMS